MLGKRTKKVFRDADSKFMLHIKIELTRLAKVLVIVVFDALVCITVMLALNLTTYLTRLMFPQESLTISLMSKVSAVSVIVFFCLYVFFDLFSYIRKTMKESRDESETRRTPK